MQLNLIKISEINDSRPYQPTLYRTKWFYRFCILSVPLHIDRRDIIPKSKSCISRSTQLIIQTFSKSYELDKNTSYLLCGICEVLEFQEMPNWAKKIEFFAIYFKLLECCKGRNNFV